MFPKSRSSHRVIAAIALLLSTGCFESKVTQQTPDQLSLLGLSLEDVSGMATQVQVRDNETLISFQLAQRESQFWVPVSLYEASIFVPGMDGDTWDYVIEVKNDDNEVVLGPQGSGMLTTDPDEARSMIHDACASDSGLDLAGPALFGLQIDLSCVSADLQTFLYRDLSGQVRIAFFPEVARFFSQGEYQLSQLQLSNKTLVDSSVEFCMNYDFNSQNPRGLMTQTLFESGTDIVYASAQFELLGNGNAEFRLYDSQGQITTSRGSVNLNTGSLTIQ